MTGNKFTAEPRIEEYQISQSTDTTINLDRKYKFVDFLFIGFGGGSYVGGGGGSGSIVQILSFDLQKAPSDLIRIFDDSPLNGGVLKLCVTYNNTVCRIGSGETPTSNIGGNGGVTKIDELKTVFGDYSKWSILSYSNGGGSAYPSASTKIYYVHGASGGSLAATGKNGSSSTIGTSVLNNNGTSGHDGGKAGGVAGGKASSLTSNKAPNVTIYLDRFIENDRLGKSGAGGKGIEVYDDINGYTWYYSGGGGGAAGAAGNGGNGGNGKSYGSRANPKSYGCGAGGCGDSLRASLHGGDAAVFLYYHNDDPSFN